MSHQHYCILAKQRGVINSERETEVGGTEEGVWVLLELGVTVSGDQSFMREGDRSQRGTSKGALGGKAKRPSKDVQGSSAPKILASQTLRSSFIVSKSINQIVPLLPLYLLFNGFPLLSGYDPKFQHDCKVRSVLVSAHLSSRPHYWPRSCQARGAGRWCSLSLTLAPTPIPAHG